MCRVQFRAVHNDRLVKCVFSVDALDYLAGTKASIPEAAVRLFLDNTLLVARAVETKIRVNDLERDGYAVLYIRDLFE